MIPAELRRAIEDALGGSIVSERPLSGGSIATSHAIDLTDGSRAFVKTHAELGAKVFEREAEGLAWLAETRTVNVPRVLATGADERGHGFLVLQRVSLAERATTAKDEERFGRELAALHRSGAASFGLATSNYLAVLDQDNTEEPDWPTFYRRRRLEPLLAAAKKKGLCSPSVERSFDRLFAILPERVGPTEPPARLHGDLWAGNRVVDGEGRSWIIDPAVYGGHREMDLAMMKLFGGFGTRVFDAYGEAAPLAQGATERVRLWQLYPLMAHLVMFGRGYLGEVEAAVTNWG